MVQSRNKKKEQGMSTAKANAKTKKERMLRAAVSAGNMQRCFYSALLFALSTPMVLFLLLFGMSAEEFKPFVIPAVFFAVFEVASACFLFHVMKRKAKRYFSMVSSAYTILLITYLICLARLQYSQSGELLLYYAAVLVGAYVIHTSFSQYVVLCVLELLGLLFVVSAAQGISIDSFMVVLFVFLFAFLLSRECYQTKCKAVSVLQEPKALMAEAEKDFLTGLLNRRGLEHAVQHLWDRYMRNGELVAAMLINIDGFRQYNEKFGHVEGDLYVRHVANCIVRTVRGKAVAARVDGGNFFVFTGGMPKQELLELAESIRMNVERLRVPYAAQGMALTVSIGIGAEKAEEDSSFLSLYKSADTMLSQAKREGKNCVKIYFRRREKYHKIG